MTDQVPHLFPSEPVAVQLMNTIWADRDGVHDALGAVDQLREWFGLSRISGASLLRQADLVAFRRLRDALRRVAAEVTADDRPSAASAMTDLDAAIAEINRSAAPRLPVLASSNGELSLQWHTDAGGRELVSSQIALEAAQLFTDEPVALGACHGPGCVLYFAKDHPRREWCSAACGNRARVARHYEKNRQTRKSRR